MFLAHWNQCFSLHVSTHLVFNVSDIISILILRDCSNQWLAPCILHVVAVRSTRVLGVLFKTKLCKSGSPSLACAHAKLKSTSSVLFPYLTMRLLKSIFARHTGFARALDALLFSSNFILYF